MLTHDFCGQRTAPAPQESHRNSIKHLQFTCEMILVRYHCGFFQIFKMRNEMRDMRTKKRKLDQSDFHIKCANMRTRKQFYHNRGRGIKKRRFIKTNYGRHTILARKTEICKLMR